MAFDLKSALELGTSIATAVGVLVAAGQLSQSRRAAQTAFEDQLFKEYRELIKELIALNISIDYLLDVRAGAPQESEVEMALRVLFRYFDLSNQQAQLYEKGRISKNIWEDWREGMKFNLQLPLFGAGYEKMRRKMGDDPYAPLTEAATFFHLHKIWLEVRRPDA